MTVCGYGGWNQLNARVICRMLGYDGALAAPRSARFGQGSGDILYVECFGTEDSLADCITVVSSSCGHHSDVGAVCYSGGTNSFGHEESTGRNCKWHTVKIATKQKELSLKGHKY